MKVNKISCAVSATGVHACDPCVSVYHNSRHISGVGVVPVFPTHVLDYPILKKDPDNSRHISGVGVVVVN